MKFTVHGRSLPSAGAIVRVACAFRECSLAAYQVLTGTRDSFLLSGHKPDGSPDGAHRHAYYLPALNGHGLICEVIVVSPLAAFTPEEAEAIRLIRALRWNGPGTTLSVALVSEGDIDEAPIACHWISASPYVPMRRYWGTHGKHHLTPEKQLATEFSRLVGVACEVDRVIPIRGLVPVRIGSRQRQAAPAALARREAFDAVIRTRAPIRGPLVLGHSAHFGLGQFRPASRNEA